MRDQHLHVPTGHLAPEDLLPVVASDVKLDAIEGRPSARSSSISTGFTIASGGRHG
nr:hypothetical protein [Noviherbaspirillum saxi]